MRNGTMVRLLLLTLCTPFGGPIEAQHPAGVTHPLDPLSAGEIEKTVRILEQSGYVSSGSLYPLITLSEPDKNAAWNSEAAPSGPRRSFAVVRKQMDLYEAIVDLSEGSVLEWRAVPGAQSSYLLSEEWSVLQRIVRADPTWRAAMSHRGIERLDQVVCVPMPAGNFRGTDPGSRRLFKVISFDGRGIRNYWGRPIEGVVALVDYHAKQVLEVTDPEHVPVSTSPVDFDEEALSASREPLHALEITQRNGASFSIKNRVVRWDNWSFHFRIDPRSGLVVSTVSFDDHGDPRKVLYQGSISELIVPYMDPGPAWYFRAFLDGGEYGLGKLTSSLEPGADCPDYARLFDTVIADDWGKPRVHKRAVALFETYSGGVAWRHFEQGQGAAESRPSRELVLRSIMSVGNYDYILDWVFRRDGSIQVAVGSTGIVQVKGVSGEAPGSANRFGRRIANNLSGVNHDHFFCFRLDLDVDGPRNGFVADRLKSKRLPRNSNRRGIWVAEGHLPETESEARLRIRLDHPALWRVFNPADRGRSGNPPSYQLKPGANARMLLDPGDPVVQRAAFTRYHLWVTPYDPLERYAAGDYPNQSPGGEGLPAWTAKDRPLQDRDLVLWYTLGFHHVVRTEDWPVMPTMWSSFEIRPFDFFEENPALDIPGPGGISDPRSGSEIRGN